MCRRIVQRSPAEQIDLELAQAAATPNAIVDLVTKGHDREAFAKMQNVESRLLELSFRGNCFMLDSLVCLHIADLGKRLLSMGIIISSRLGDDDEVRAQLLEAASRCDEADRRTFRSAMHLVLLKYRMQHDLEGAYAALFAAMDGAVLGGRRSLLGELAGFGHTLSLELFSSISWDPVTKKRRSDDPRDFVDFDVIGLNQTSKYGMKDRDEDFATFGTLVLIDDRVDAKYLESAHVSLSEVDLTSYVRALVAQGKFELAAKYLVFHYIMWFFPNAGSLSLRCPRTSPQFVTTEEVLEALDKATNVPEWAATAIRLSDAVKTSVERRCAAATVPPT